MNTTTSTTDNTVASASHNQNDNIIVVVGDGALPGNIWTLSRTLLCEKSEFCRLTFGSPSTAIGNDNHQIHLPAADKSAWQLIVNWMHAAALLVLPSYNFTTDLVFWAQLWFTAQKLGVNQMCDDIQTTLKSCYSGKAWEFNVAAVKMVYDTTSTITEFGLKNTVLELAVETLMNPAALGTEFTGVNHFVEGFFLDVQTFAETHRILGKVHCEFEQCVEHSSAN